MKVKCPSCSKVLNIPDDKLPIGETKKFNCPNCKNPVTAQRESETSESLPDMGSAPDHTPTPRPLDETQDIPVPPKKPVDVSSLQDMMGAIENDLEILGEGKYRAMVADDANIDMMAPVLKKMEYVVTRLKSHQEGIEKLNFNQYDLVIINERFDGAEPNNNTLLKFIEPMTMDVRRKMFVVLTGKNFRTFDNMSAFVRSVNLVMNESDFGNFELILKKGMNDNQMFYRVYNQMLVETGKELGS